ncbi:MAG: Crp/Fnr family transcriptional regulator [Silicimonas sp.]|nr:Crp/Fnr family transcriptional regulator [Silicimonas sp.]
MKPLTEMAQSSQIFRNVPRMDVLDLISKGSVKEAERGASIHLQGERAHSLFIVLEGWVKLYRMSSCGNEAVVGVLSNGDCFGEAAAVPGEVFSTGAEAVAASKLLQIDAQDLWHAIDSDPVLCRAFLGATLSDNRALVHQLGQLKSHTAAQRIADFLLSLCKDEVGECIVVLPYDKVLIAGWLGMKPESLSRAFRRLEPYGVKIRKDRALIQSVERLLAFADEDPSKSWSEKAWKTS